MRKSEMENKWEQAQIREYLHKSAREEQIPKSLLPEQMEQWLRQQTSQMGEKGEEIMRKRDQDFSQEQKEPRKRGKYFRWWCGSLAAAACLALVLYAAGRNMDWELGTKKNGASASDTYDKMESAAGEAAEESAIEKEESSEGTTYDKIYQSFDKIWRQQEELFQNNAKFAEREMAVDDAAAAEAGEAASGADAGGAESYSLDQSADSSAEMTKAEGEAGDFGKTNQQEEAVEEADIIKNDGRYLYQVVCREDNSKYAVRIADTKDGLKEAACVGSFEVIQDIYIWEDKLVVLEPGWAESAAVNEPVPQRTEYMDGADSGGFIQILKAMAENIFTNGETATTETATTDMAYSGYAYCRIHVYDISDRSNPQEYHTFTVKGSYMDSRISNGYLYFFTSCQADRPSTKEDYKAYIPTLDGEPMAEDKIFLPQETDETAYLVMASIDMERPNEFVDSHALVTSADKFYVSEKNIYVADTQYAEYNKEGKSTDSTKLYRYSYKDGRMHKDAEGTVKGTLRDDMSINEYQDHLRLVTTVESMEVEKIVDDLSGEELGYDSASMETTNSLYVLDQNLQVAGKIEHLAKDERIYSARFMGASGYFVTFRETDPLFSVDLSNPKDPKILGELKISGFSEYLHFYADNLLLGIGMEADEKTGQTKGMKLSMFDISNPTDVKEQSKLDLSEYDYSDALYNYKAVLIDPKKNLFGFSAESYSEDSKRMYLLFSYRDGGFQEIMKIDCSDNNRYSWTIRGTYIKDRFFLLSENGLIEEYSLTDGSKTAELQLIDR